MTKVMTSQRRWAWSYYTDVGQITAHMEKTESCPAYTLPRWLLSTYNILHMLSTLLRTANTSTQTAVTKSVARAAK